MQASNLYATRIYSEHPIGLWPIDDDLSFVSLITDANRNMTTWNTTAVVTRYSSFRADSVAEPPFARTDTYKLTGQTDTQTWQGKTYYGVSATSPNLFVPYYDLNADQHTFSVSLHLYHNNKAAFYDVGYKYGTLTFTERIMAGQAKTWNRISKTFEQEYPSQAVQVYIKVYFADQADMSFMVNGLSVGQWSEPYGQTLGVTPKNIARTTGLPLLLDRDVLGVPLREYGPGNDTGYAIIENQRLLAVNGGIPLVYGSGSVTTLIESQEPSIVVPGKGFLHNDGRHNNYTLEMWLRLHEGDRRIVGPVASKDGLYIKGSTLCLVIGDSFETFNLGRLYRPMLLHLTLGQTATVMVNGTTVIDMAFDRTSALPDNTLFNQDWLGLYGPMEIDTVSIFPYVVPAAVAKRRFVWGQGVESPEPMNSAYLGTATSVDFSYARYPVNFSFPESAGFDRGHNDNLEVTDTYIKMPDFELPQWHTGRMSPKQIMESSKQERGDTSITFAANSDTTYLYYPRLDVLPDPVAAFYGVFSGLSGYSTPLFIVNNKQTGVQFRADIDGNLITYSFNGKVYETAVVMDKQIFAVGLNIENASQDLQNFFANPAVLELFIGGYDNAFYRGKIYRFGFSKYAITTDDIINPLTDLMEHLSQYVLKPVFEYGQYYLDVQSHGVWSELIPLSYFATNNVIDLMQYNVGTSGVTTRITIGRIDSHIEERDNVTPGQIIDMRSDNFMDKTYIIDNNTVIIPPRNPGRYAMLLSVEFNGLAKTDRIVVKDLSLAAFTHDDDKFLQLGTKHGVDIAPYTRVGVYYDQRINRPWTMYKESAPYLYLTDDSGVRPLENLGGTEAGLWITINKNKEPDFSLSSLQIWLKPDYPPDDPIELFCIKSDHLYIKFMAASDGTGKRIKLYAADGWTDEEYNGVRFHQDGSDVVTPYIESGKWSALGIDFEPLLIFDSEIASLSLFAGAVFNNIVCYKTTALQARFTYEYRTWSEIANGKTWQNVLTTYGIWDNVAKASQTSKGSVSVDEIYKTYVGTNRYVLDDELTALMLISDRGSVISSRVNLNAGQSGTNALTTNDPQWTTIVRKAE